MDNLILNGTYVINKEESLSRDTILSLRSHRAVAGRARHENYDTGAFTGLKIIMNSYSIC